MRTSFLAFVASAALLSGCTATYALGPKGVIALDGFDASNPDQDERTITDKGGGRVVFTDDTPLTLTDADGKSWSSTYRHIRVEHLDFVGTKSGGQDVIIDLGKVTAAEVEVTSTGRTVALVVAVTLGAALVGGAIGVTVFAANFKPFPSGPWH